MDDTLTIVIQLNDGQTLYVSLEKGKVVGGSVGRVIQDKGLIISKKYDLCGYPYVELVEEDNNNEGVGVLA